MTQEAGKIAAATYAASLVREGMKVGLGTGSTSLFFLEALIKRVKGGLKIEAIASSKAIHEKALAGGLPLLDEQKTKSLDVTFDGADNVDLQKQLIKGGGGALFREKILASMSKKMIVMVDDSKCTMFLEKVPVPVEILPFGYLSTINRIEEAGFLPKLRLIKEGFPFITDNGNYIADISFNTPIYDPKSVEETLRGITGVLETGLFLDLATEIIVGYGDKKVEIR